MDDDRLLEKYKTNWTKNEDLKIFQLSALPVYDDRYIKTKIETYKFLLIFVVQISNIFYKNLD